MRQVFAVLAIVCICGFAECQDWKQVHKTDPLHDSTYEEFRLEGKWLTPPQRSASRNPVLVLQCRPGGPYTRSRWDSTYRRDAHGKLHGEYLASYIDTGTVLDGGSFVATEYRLDAKPPQKACMGISTDYTSAYFDVYSSAQSCIPGRTDVDDILLGRGALKEGETRQTHKVLFAFHEHLGAQILIQFDFPDVAQVADQCGWIEHKR